MLKHQSLQTLIFVNRVLGKLAPEEVPYTLLTDTAC